MARHRRACGASALLWVTLVGCGPRGGAAVAPHEVGPGRPALLSAELSLGEHADVSLALATPGDPSAAARLAELLSKRLQRAPSEGLAPTVAFGADGVRVHQLVPAGQERAALTQLRQALLTPVSPSEANQERAKQALARLPVAEPASASLARCRGVFFRSSTEDASPELETLRKRYAAAVSLGSAGSREANQALRRALLDLPSWTLEAPPPAAAIAAGAWQLRPTPSPSTRVWLLDWQPSTRARAQLTLGRELGHPGPLGVALAGTGAELEQVDAVLSPAGGACIAIGLRWEAHPDLDAMSAAVAMVEARVQSLSPLAIERAKSESWLTEGAVSSHEIAERAALTALAERLPGQHERRYVVEWPQSHGEPAMPSAEALGRALEGAEKAPALTFASEVRPGLGEAWLLLASPCGTRGEGEHDAGASAAYAWAAARRARALGAHALPWIDADRIGIVLRRRLRPNESARERAQRLGELGTQAWLGEGLDFEASLRAIERTDTDGALDAQLAGAQHGPTARLGFSEGDAHAALALGPLATLRPLGTVRSRRALRAETVKVRGESLARAPMVAAYLAPTVGEAEHAERVLGSLLRSRSACPAAPAQAAPGASTEGRVLRIAGTSEIALALIAAPAQLSEADWQSAREYLALALPGWLEGQLRAYRVDRWGKTTTTPASAALALRLALPHSARESALTTLRSRLAELGRGQVDRALWATARARARAAALAAEGQLPIVLDRLWSAAAKQPPATPPWSDPSDPTRTFALLFQPGNLVLVTSDP